MTQKSPSFVREPDFEDDSKVKVVFKKWMSALNQWVVRSENLKKYHVLKIIGQGAQAKVYQAVRKD